MRPEKSAQSEQKLRTAKWISQSVSIDRSSSNRNAHGVRCLREGKLEESISVFRSLVMPPGCCWTRLDAPLVYRRNFATALLLAGHPSGCLGLLAEMRDENHPRVKQLRSAIKRWEQTLSLLQWLNWRIGWIDPANRPVTIDFVPGEVEGDFLSPGTDSTTSATLHLTTVL